VIKSLADVILPAVDPDNKVVREQLQLCIATLAMVQERLPLVHRFCRALLEDAQVVCRLLAGAIAQSDRETQATLIDADSAAERVLQDTHCSTNEYERQLAEMNGIIAGAIAAAQGSDAYLEIERVLVEAAKPSIALNRAWCLPAGFEPYPAHITSIKELLGCSASL
jgi:hypothetical protein